MGYDPDKNSPPELKVDKTDCRVKVHETGEIVGSSYERVLNIPHVENTEFEFPPYQKEKTRGHTFHVFR